MALSSISRAHRAAFGDVSTGVGTMATEGKQLVDGVTQIYNGLNDKKKGLVAGVDNFEYRT